METTATLPVWCGFLAFVLWATYIDLKGNGAKEGPMTTARAWSWSLIWVASALLFCLALGLQTWFNAGIAEATKVASQFLTGYLLEKSLAVDNIFVFLLLFRQFGVPPELQPRALSLGIIMAVGLRCLMIGLGALLISKFQALLYFFGAFLVWSGYKMWKSEISHSSGESGIAKWLSQRIPVTPDFHGQALTIKVAGRRLFTPLFLVLVSLGLTDIIFAVDSIPAVFAVTQDPFIVLTSNIFAVLGLRAMYFLVAHCIDRFHYLSKGLALVLAYIGAKMLLVQWIHISPLLSLSIVCLILGGSLLLSLRRGKEGSGQ